MWHFRRGSKGSSRRPSSYLSSATSKFAFSSKMIHDKKPYTSCPTQRWTCLTFSTRVRHVNSSRLRTTGCLVGNRARMSWSRRPVSRRRGANRLSETPSETIRSRARELPCLERWRSRWDKFQMGSCKSWDTRRSLRRWVWRALNQVLVTLAQFLAWTRKTQVLFHCATKYLNCRYPRSKHRKSQFLKPRPNQRRW